MTIRTTPLKPLVSLPAAADDIERYGRSSMRKACGGNERMGDVLNFFVYRATGVAQRLETEQLEYIRVEECPLDAIAERTGLSKKSIISYIKELAAYGYLKAYGYHHTYDVYFRKINEAIAHPPDPLPVKPRGKHARNSLSPEEQIVKLQSRYATLHDQMVKIQSQIVNLQSQMVNLQSQMVNLPSSQSREAALEQGTSDDFGEDRIIENLEKGEEGARAPAPVFTSSDSPYVSPERAALDASASLVRRVSDSHVTIGNSEEAGELEEEGDTVPTLTRSSNAAPAATGYAGQDDREATEKRPAVRLVPAQPHPEYIPTPTESRSESTPTEPVTGSAPSTEGEDVPLPPPIYETVHKRESKIVFGSPPGPPPRVGLRVVPHRPQPPAKQRQFRLPPPTAYTPSPPAPEAGEPRPPTRAECELSEARERGAIWQLVEQVFGTRYPAGVRAEPHNERGMNGLLKDGWSHEEIKAGLEKLDAFDRGRFRVDDFRSRLPGLLSGAPVPLGKNGKVLPPPKPKRSASPWTVDPAQSLQVVRI